MADNESLTALAGRTFAAVLFDMDGTLIDSTPAVERSWMRWAGEFGVHLTGFGTWHGIPAAQVVSQFLPPEQWEVATRRIEQIETEDTDGVVVLPGAAEALAALAPSGRAAIATSCVHDLALARIATSGLIAPEVLVTADMVEVGKPDPAPYRLPAQRLGVDPADCLVVEDAPAGLTSGKEAGAARLALATTHSADTLEADAVVKDLSHVRFVVTTAGVRVASRS
ncbi:HAD-IA family hydrolase [Kineosporia succinea]|uniref:Sugar-phosphatase n=1 Tax=Kineosporia succinea TaxID=84632 RepID=A0ABT9NW64_9ACTN|nr:HAD-IA family hydrolase [Kineosporia succinea]MDP9824662.1 sugar-phosphatase [Kineosporia succinea]